MHPRFDLSVNFYVIFQTTYSKDKGTSVLAAGANTLCRRHFLAALGQFFGMVNTLLLKCNL